MWPGRFLFLVFILQKNLAKLIIDWRRKNGYKVMFPSSQLFIPSLEQLICMQ